MFRVALVSAILVFGIFGWIGWNWKPQAWPVEARVLSLIVFVGLFLLFGTALNPESFW